MLEERKWIDSHGWHRVVCGDVKVPRDLREETSQEDAALVASLKQRIRDARLCVSFSVNQELILLYWGIGRDILLMLEEDGWGNPGS